MSRPRPANCGYRVTGSGSVSTGPFRLLTCSVVRWKAIPPDPPAFTGDPQPGHTGRGSRDATLWDREVRPVKTDNGPRVLVVDDEPSIVDAVATSLRYEGFTVDEAITGRKALAQAQEEPPDLVILDVMLPDLDGLEVTRRLRSDGVRVPILFLTARDTLQDKLAGLTVGGDDYVTKPFALAEVIARVHAILRRTGYEPEEDGVLRFADLELDESADEVRRGRQRGGDLCELPAQEAGAPWAAAHPYHPARRLHPS